MHCTSMQPSPRSGDENLSAFLARAHSQGYVKSVLIFQGITHHPAKLRAPYWRNAPVCNSHEWQQRGKTLPPKKSRDPRPPRRTKRLRTENNKTPKELEVFDPISTLPSNFASLLERLCLRRHVL